MTRRTACLTLFIFALWIFLLKSSLISLVSRLPEATAKNHRIIYPMLEKGTILRHFTFYQLTFIDY